MQNQEFFKSANILPQKFAVQPLPKTKPVETSVSEKTVEDDLLKIIRDGFAKVCVTKVVLRKLFIRFE